MTLKLAETSVVKSRPSVLYGFNLFIMQSVFTQLARHRLLVMEMLWSHSQPDHVVDYSVTDNILWCRVCCSRWRPCRAVSDHLHRHTKLHKRGHRVWANRLWLQSVRQTLDSGSRLASSLHSHHRAEQSETRSCRSRRQKSNANCQNGWVQLPAAKLLQRRNWKIVRFSLDSDFRLCHCFFYLILHSAVSI